MFVCLLVGKKIKMSTFPSPDPIPITDWSADMLRDNLHFDKVSNLKGMKKKEPLTMQELLSAPKSNIFEVRLTV